jgi:hypothetical protein
MLNFTLVCQVWRMWVNLLIHLHSVTEIFLTKLTEVRQSFVRNSYTDGFDASKYQPIRGFYHTSLETKILNELNV